MTNEPPYVGEAREGAPCCVRHPHAGDQCERPATMAVYGLFYCEPHGAQAAEGASEEARHDAQTFLDQFRHPELRRFPVLLERAIEAASSNLYDLLFRAFPEPTAEVRRMVGEAEAADDDEHEPFADVLIGSLHTTHRCMRIALEEREVWLLEILEGERQGIAAQCAYAVRNIPAPGRGRAGAPASDQGGAA